MCNILCTRVCTSWPGEGFFFLCRDVFCAAFSFIYILCTFIISRHVFRRQLRPRVVCSRNNNNNNIIIAKKKNIKKKYARGGSAPRFDGARCVLYLIRPPARSSASRIRRGPRLALATTSDSARKPFVDHTSLDTGRRRVRVFLDVSSPCTHYYYYNAIRHPHVFFCSHSPSLELELLPTHSAAGCLLCNKIIHNYIII